MNNPSENRIFIAIQALVALAIFAIFVAWVSVVIPVTVLCFGAIYVALFVVGWTARLVTSSIRRLRRT